MRKFGSCLIFLCIIANSLYAQFVTSIESPEIIASPVTQSEVKKLNVAEIKIVGNIKQNPTSFPMKFSFKLVIAFVWISLMNSCIPQEI